MTTVAIRTGLSGPSSVRAPGSEARPDADNSGMAVGRDRLGAERIDLPRALRSSVVVGEIDQVQRPGGRRAS